MKTLYIMLGPKGAGKSYISELMEKELGVKFFRVEDIWIKLEGEGLEKEEKVIRGRKKIIEGLQTLFEIHQAISIESTGTSEGFFKFVKKLKREYMVLVVKVMANKDICRHRVEKRDTNKHVKYEWDEFEQVNQVASESEYEYDLLIENNYISDAELVKMLGVTTARNE